MKRVIGHIILAAVSTSLLWFILVMLPGCGYTRDKAQSQFGKAVLTFPEIGANFCEITYPVRTRTDSTEYKRSRDIIDSILRVFKTDSLISQSERDSLLRDIERVRALIKVPEDCDSLSDAIYRLAAKERQRADRLQEANSKLAAAAANVKPIRDTVENTARVENCELERKKVVGLFEGERAEKEVWKKRARTRGMIMWGLFIAIGLTVAYKLRNQFLKPKI